MATLVGAFTALATFAGTVNGIKHSYDLGDTPDNLTRDKLVCAMVFPETGEGMNFTTLAFGGNAPVLKFNMQQIIFVAATENTPYHKVAPKMLKIVDDYLLTLKDLPFLGPESAPPIHNKVSVKPRLGVTDFAGTEYHVIDLNFLAEILL